jgi:hypothetical protein
VLRQALQPLQPVNWNLHAHFGRQVTVT